MRKNPKTYPLAPIAANRVYHTAFALLAATIADALFKVRNKFRIGIDLMGGDNPPEAILNSLKNLPSHVVAIPIGLEQFASADFEYCIAPEFISMDESPLIALRKKRKSSLSTGLRMLANREIDAFISSGNTGALVSASKMILGTLPSIQRPALLAQIPTKKNPIAVLDVGANVQTRASHLVQFAHLGAAFCHKKGIVQPRVGLLNIGSEPIKGTSELRLAYQKLATLPNPPFTFVGNIEGKTVFDGHIDVLVTDGFTGNIFLKTAEGAVGLALSQFQAQLSKQQMKALHPQTGAILSGVKGLVIKCHGYAPPEAFVNAALSITET